MVDCHFALVEVTAVECRRWRIKCDFDPSPSVGATKTFVSVAELVAELTWRLAGPEYSLNNHSKSADRNSPSK